METRQKKTALVAAAAVLGVAAVIAIALLVSSGTKTTTTNPGGGTPGGSPPPGGGNAPPGGWTSFQSRRSLIIKAEEAKQLLGKMKLDTGLDNEKVLDASGRRAQVTFIEVPDEACEKGKESESKASFEMKVEQAGTYYPWARAWWKDSCGDSMVVILRLQGASQKPLELLITDGTYQFWHWVAMAGSQGLKLEKGTYDVIAENREDGARLSRILFSTQDYESHMPTTPDD